MLIYLIGKGNNLQLDEFINSHSHNSKFNFFFIPFPYELQMNLIIYEMLGE